MFTHIHQRGEPETYNIQVNNLAVFCFKCFVFGYRANNLMGFFLNCFVCFIYGTAMMSLSVVFILGIS